MKLFISISLLMVCLQSAFAAPLPSFQVALGGVLYSPGVEVLEGHFGTYSSIASYLDVSRCVSVGVECGLQSYPGWDGHRNTPFSIFRLIPNSSTFTGSHRVKLSDGSTILIDQPVIINSDLCVKYSFRDWELFNGIYCKLGFGAINYRTGDRIHSWNYWFGDGDLDEIEKGEWKQQKYVAVVGFGGEHRISDLFCVWGDTTIRSDDLLKMYSWRHNSIVDIIFQFGLKINKIDNS